MKKILVWDLPVRLGHWLMAGGFTSPGPPATASRCAWCMSSPAAR